MKTGYPSTLSGISVISTIPLYHVEVSQLMQSGSLCPLHPDFFTLQSLECIEKTGEVMIFGRGLRRRIQSSTFRTFRGCTGSSLFREGPITFFNFQYVALLQEHYTLLLLLLISFTGRCLECTSPVKSVSTQATFRN